MTNKKTFFQGRLRATFLGRFLHSLDLTSYPIHCKFMALADLLLVIVQAGKASLRELSSVFGKYLSLIGRALYAILTNFLNFSLKSYLEILRI